MLKFTTKAQVLCQLRDVLNTAKVLPLAIVTYSGFKQDFNSIYEKLLKLKAKNIIIRSSSQNEDTCEYSNAGKYLSIPDIPLNNKGLVKKALTKVFNSYSTLSNSQEVLIQPMLNNIDICGVVFTSTLDSLAPYYIINYDNSGSTNSITSGTIEEQKIFYSYKYAPIKPKNPLLNIIIPLCQELENLFNFPYLDIEFAITKNKEVFVFQVRPITQKNNISKKNQEIIKKTLSNIFNYVKSKQTTQYNILGKRSIFGVMPDWNPAEIIGTTPKPLALSIYKELVTDYIWAYQRNNYGYRNLRSHPLLISFSNVPFIDVRVSFNSFIPKELNTRIAEKLVNYYLDKLESKPSHHDKIEFNIVHSCYYFGLPDKLELLKTKGFNKQELKRIEFSLLNITNKVIDPSIGYLKKDLEKTSLLDQKFKTLKGLSISPIDKLYWLIEDCKRYGTLPFAGAARAGFIAIQLLKSFITTNIITENEYSQFLNSLKTVSKLLAIDIQEYYNKKVSKEYLLEKYGHLRPGTYDIESKTYKENFDNYFSSISSDKISSLSSFKFSKKQKNLLDSHLIDNGLIGNASNIIQFIIEAIEGREYSKFIFTRSLSYILDLVYQIGEKENIPRKDLAYLDINFFKKLYSQTLPSNFKESLLNTITTNKVNHSISKLIKLPHLITSPEDCYNFYIAQDEPNLIGHNRVVQANIVLEDQINITCCKNKIIFIKSADPGYDFLFTKGIVGLVTQFGGVNSHMAIRCAEQNIPAIIGAGEKHYQKWIKAKKIELNTESGTVRMLE